MVLYCMGTYKIDFGDILISVYNITLNRLTFDLLKKAIQF